MVIREQNRRAVEVALQMGRGLSTLTYLRPKSVSPEECLLGRRVQIEIGRRITTGVVTREDDVTIPEGIALKEIKFVTDDAPVLTKNQLSLAQFVSDYYEASYFDCLKLCLPRSHGAVDAKVFEGSKEFLEILKCQFARKSKSSKVRRQYLRDLDYSDSQINDFLLSGELSLPHQKDNLVAGDRRWIPYQARNDTLTHQFNLDDKLTPQFNPVRGDTKVPKTSEKVLNPEQLAAVHSILNGNSKAFLLEGVTGSGKTEVYLEVAKSVLAKGKSVVFIVPEIALTPQLFRRVQSALDHDVALIHSNIKSSQRDLALEEIRSGKKKVVIGARSALFCPARDLGLIIVDEEHDTGFKQDESPRYHARDVALWRAHAEGAQIILGSATPSLESLHNVALGRLQRLRLTKRVGLGLMPKVEIVNLCERRSSEVSRLKDRSASHGQGLCILSSPLRTAIEATLARKEQVILFLNRRGWASYLICEECGNILKCPDCSISLTYHKKTNLLRCHQCSYTKAFQTKCSECPDGVLKPLGLGTERVEKELQMSFPEATVARFDKESVHDPRDLQETLDKLQSGEIQILIGTQMIAKGHDFPNVTLVGVILADNGLSLPDFRASERTFQLLTQVSGRAGRRQTQGQVIIQTFNPDHPAIVFAKNHDVSGFAKFEMQERKQFYYPPFSRAALIRIEALSEEDATRLSLLVREYLDLVVEQRELSASISILGPAPCSNLKLRKYFRWQIFIKATNVSARKQILSRLRHEPELNRQFAKAKSRLVIDVDPIQML